MDQVLGQLAGREVVAELPAVPSQNEECTDGMACCDLQSLLSCCLLDNLGELN